MNAKEGFIIRLLDGTDKKIIVPVYQRPYSWKKSNCELLFSDLRDIAEKGAESHFFGSVVYVSKDIGGVTEYTIIDGQQRITTVSLLLVAIRNYIIQKGIDVGIKPEKITNAYLTDQYADNTKKLKLKLVQGDDMAYDRLILDADPIENNNVTVNYNYFYGEISNLTNQQLKNLYDAIMKLAIVNVSLNPQMGDDPQLIFESLNSTGKALEESDKIRNFILMNLSAKEQERIYKKYWEPLENLVARNDIDTFIRYYLAVKTRELINKSKLYFAFKLYMQGQNSKNDDVLTDMLRYAGYYSEIRNISKTSYAASTYKDVLARLINMEMNTAIPLLFDLFAARDNGHLNDNEFENALQLIENYVARREICDLPTNALNKIFVSLGSEINRYMKKDKVKYIDAFEYSIISKTGRSRFPNNHEFQDRFETYELYATKPAIKKYVLERLENYGTKEKVAVAEQIEAGTLTIEHVMPQTLTKEWKKALGSNWELIHTKYKDTVGNLTLTAYNSDYSNLPFLKKRDMKDKGFKASKLSLNKYIKQCNSWGEVEIVKRASLLYTKAQKIWWMPKPAYRPQTEDEWVFWDDDFDFSGKKIIKMKIFGDEIATDNISDAYKKINITLFSLDSIGYSDFDNRYHNSNAELLLKPYEIGTDMYIDTNLSSQSKMDIVHELFSHFEFNSSDLQFLVKNNTSDKQFDVDDESLLNSLTTGRLAYELLSRLLNNNQVTSEEIEKLKTVEYTRKTFDKVVYPYLADTRDAYQSKGRKMRYKKEPIIVDGRELFVSSEWYDYNRESLVAWYKKHLKV